MSPREGWLVWFSKLTPRSKSPNGIQQDSPLHRQWMSLLRQGSSLPKAAQVWGAAPLPPVLLFLAARRASGGSTRADR